jgi:two-component system, OmpR family, phosphate regulon sensor histidine kinase PhoR
MSRLWVLVPAAAVLLGLVSALVAQQSIIAGAGVAILLGLIGSAALLRPIISSAESIKTAARALASGDYTARAVYRGPAELGDFTDAFNQMAQRIQVQMAAASEGRNRLMAALDSSVDPVLALDVEGRVLFANLAAQRLFERSGEAIAHNPVAWLVPDEKIIEAVRQSRESGTQMRFEIERPGRRFFQVVTSSITSGGEWAVLVVIHDVSDVKRTDQIRRDFVANVSHELRTPLAGIKAVIETLAEGALDDREAATDFLIRADSEVDRLIQLVEELLDLSRIESGDVPLVPRPTDIDVLVREVVERLQPQAERKRITLVLDTSTGAGTAEVDPDRLERAMVNLVQNAVKFTPEDGAVTISANRKDGSLILKVTDTGIGIDSGALSRIFERFYKADQSRAGRAGSGIGLAIVKHAVEAHGGSVEAESRLGVGSTFTVTLPVRP